jgi:CspA family cold shock protein
MTREPDKGLKIGTVTDFSADRGYGFIEPESGGRVFFHHTSLQMAGFRDIASGTPVEYSVMLNPETGRWQAATVRALSPVL